MSCLTSIRCHEKRLFDLAAASSPLRNQHWEPPSAFGSASRLVYSPRDGCGSPESARENRNRHALRKWACLNLIIRAVGIPGARLPDGKKSRLTGEIGRAHV